MILLALMLAGLGAPLLGLPARIARAEDPSFATRRTFGTGADTTASVQIGDIDGDGALDIVAGNAGAQSAVYLNGAGASFRNGPVDCTSTNQLRCFGGPADPTSSLALGDINGDGWLDIVVANDGGQNAVYLNDAAGHFAQGAADCAGALVRCFGTGADATQAVALGDLNGDGRLDIAAANRGQQSAVYLNDPAGFGRGAADCVSALLRCFGDPASNTTSVVFANIADIPPLGAIGLDLVAGRSGKRNAVFVNQGSGQFAHGPSTCSFLSGEVCFGTAGSGTTSVAAGDIDGNGTPEVVTSNANAPATLFIVSATTATEPSIISYTLPISTSAGAPLGASRTVTLADVTNDGYLDLTIGYSGPNLVYLSDLGRVSLTDVLTRKALPAYASPNFDQDARSIAIGDLNGDGNLDMVVGKHGQNALYLSNGPAKIAAQGAMVRSFGNAADTIAGLAVGDMNGDHRLDLVVGKRGGQSELQINAAGQGFAARPFGGPTDQTSAVAVGDMNGDRLLDIVAARDGGQSAVLLNQGGGSFATTPADCRQTIAQRCFGRARDAAASLAIGDLDNNGALDIVASYRDQATTAYLNNGAGVFSTIRMLSDPAGAAHVALGDLDDDGDLDIIAGNRIFLNNGSSFFTGARRFGGDVAAPLAVGDMNGDGHQDIVSGNRIFFNPGDARFVDDFVACDTTPGVRCVETPAAALALNDLNGDGSLDLVIGSTAQSTAYLNDGAGNFFGGAVVCGFVARTQCFGSGNDTTRAVALGDMNGDGYPDIVAGNTGQLSKVYLNGLSTTLGQPHTQPHVTIERPGATQDGAGFSTPEILAGPVIPISYTLQSADSTPVRFIRAAYSIDGGGTWRPAVPTTDTTTTDLAASPAGTPHLYKWDMFKSGVFGQSSNVIFRIDAYPAPHAAPSAPATPSLRPFLSAQSFPFRVRGTQVHVTTETGQDAPGATVYRRAFGRDGPAQPLGGGGQAFLTDGQGYLQGHGALAPNDQLVALLPITATSSYTMYLTSAAPISSGLALQIVRAPGVQELVVAASNPLILFNLKVAIEWDARYDAQFIARLRADLGRSSELLYDWSNGQVALGQVSVTYDREGWDDADVRIYASNRVRPTAAQGGIVTALLTETAVISAGRPLTSTLVYEPGQIHIGAIWNRFGTSGGNLAEDWPRALAHEIGHYALFLNDNYIGLNPDGILVPTPGNRCPSAMSDPYRDDYTEFHPDADWNTGAQQCADTLSNQTTGRSDWSTIAAFYPVLIKPAQPADLNPGPSNLPIEVTSIRFIDPAAPVAARAVPIFYLKRDGATYVPGPSARAFLYQGQRLIDLGRPTLDQVLARGARPGDRVCMYETSALLLGCTSVGADNEQIALSQQDDWQPDITVTPESATLLRLNVGNLTDTLALQAQLYPLSTTAATTISLTYDQNAHAYQGAFALSEPVAEGYLRVWAVGPGALREIVTDYSLGGAPGFRRGNGSFRRGNGGFRRGNGAPLASANGDITLFGRNLAFAPGQFFAFQAATVLPEPPSWASLVGQAYRLTASPQAPSLNEASISFGYQRADVPAGEESGLRLYFWAGQQWDMLATALDPLNTSASALMRGPGLYALMSSLVVPIPAAGWNLVAYPSRITQPVGQALRSIDGMYTIVYSYDPADAADPWKVYDPAAPAWVNTLQNLEYGRGYWIYATKPSELYLKGGLGQAPAARLQTSPLAPLTPPAVFYGEVAASAAGAPASGMAVEAQINGATCGQGQTRAEAGAIVYAIQVRAAGPDGCGALGTTVTISLAALGETAQQSWDNRQAQHLPLGAPQKR